MLDQKLIRNELDNVARRLLQRGYSLEKDRIVELESQRKDTQVTAQKLQTDRNSQSKLIGQYKAKGQNTSSLQQQVTSLAEHLQDAETKLSKIQVELNSILLCVPNLPHETVPEGKDENANVELRRWGEPKNFGFTVRDHVDLGKQLGTMDFELATKITGSRFIVFLTMLVTGTSAVGMR